MAYTIVNGTSGNNFLYFIGIEGFYSATLVNPYSGYTVTINENKYVNNAIYDGRAGTDTLTMTSLGDVLMLVDAAGTIMIKDVEIFSAGEDGDIIILADAAHNYGNVTIRGANGDDILWSNNGNDLIQGGAGNDIIDGGGGNDSLYGGIGDDYLAGGLGVDALFGGEGDDTLAYNADAVWSGGVNLHQLGSTIPFSDMINLDGYNRSYDTFHGDLNESLQIGNPGTDRLIMTSGNDVLVISDTLSPATNLYSPRVAYMDVIDAGAGDDIVDLSGADHIAVTIHGGEGNDILAGSWHGDTINGDEGDDRLYGAGGNDVLSGGVGNDVYYYNAGDGSDTIIENDGNDSIVFGAGISLSSLNFSVSGSDLLIGIGNETITIQNHFAPDHSGRVETLVFDDNSTYDLSSYGLNVDPVAINDTFSGHEDTVITGNVLDNDTDENGDTLNIIAQTITTAQGGTVVLNADGTFSYQGAANFHGTDGFDYTVLDGQGGSATASVTLDVVSVNDTPVANDDLFSGNEDEVITGNVLNNDTDEDDATLEVVAETITTENGGTVILNADGSFTYQGAVNFNGNDTFNYTARDAAGATAVGTVMVAVAAVNDSPVAQADYFDGLRNSTVTGNVFNDNGAGADFDVDGDVLSVQAQTITTAQGGTVTLSADGSFTYNPANGFFGSDSFDYTLLDAMGGSDVQTVSLNVALDPSQSIIGTDNSETIMGTNGDDEIFGLNGDDVIIGQNGNDVINGGEGNDILYGDDSFLTGTTRDKAFADTVVMPNLKESVNIKDLRPSGEGARGIAEGNLSVDYDATATITFRKGYAGYDNSFGSFAIAADGTIINTSMEWKNVKTAGIDVAHTIDLPTGAEGGAFGFFIIGNGNNTNGGYAGLDVTGDSKLSFVYNYGKADQRAATINDAGAKISLVYSDGVTTKVLKGDIYFTTERDGSTAINKDGKAHVVSGLMDSNNLLLDPKKADLSAKPNSFTKNNITVAAMSGNLVASGDKIGIKSTTNNGDIIAGNEVLAITLGMAAQKMIVSLSDIAGNGTGIDFKIFMDGSMSPINYEYVTGATNGGKIDIVLDAASFGLGLITKIEISSVANSFHGTETFWLDNIIADIPGGVDTNTLRIGFEDLYGTGDADYEDVLFDLDINPIHVGDVGGGNDILDGGAGNDILYGEGGNDILVIGLGFDRAYGGEGADVFAVTAIDEFVDVIHDFSRAQGDSINIADVLTGYDPLADDIANFVRLVQNGGDTELQINADGDAGGAFVTAAMILGGTGLDLATLIGNGGIVADHSALA